jgi:glycosyltransferase involved in cell wall biosynthesis
MIKADLMATTPDLASQLPDQAAFSNPPVALPRYAPDPKIFFPSDNASSNPILLFAGKINYYWRLKALDTLLAALKLRQNWRLEMVADGKGLEAFEAEAEKHELAERISRRSFISPDRMPSLLSKATAVWAVERQGTIIDFSNIIWETLAVGRPCLVSSSMLKHPDAVQLRDSPLLLVVDPEDPVSISEALDKAASMKVFERPPSIAKAFETYIEATADLYLKAARANGAT